MFTLPSVALALTLHATLFLSSCPLACTFLFLPFRALSGFETLPLCLRSPPVVFYRSTSVLRAVFTHISLTAIVK